jgi:hypothetical protein
MGKLKNPARYGAAHIKLLAGCFEKALGLPVSLIFRQTDY